MELKHLLSEGSYAYKGLLLGKKPTIVYAPGRVGSMGLLKNLRKAGVYSFKVESFTTEKRGATDFVRKHFIFKHKSVNIISPVRDPIALLCSYYFSKCLKGWIREGYDAILAGDINSLQDHFIKDVLQTDRLENQLYWLENDFEKNLHVNVFDHPFDTEKKYSIIDHDTYPTLIYRIDTGDSYKVQIINSFLGIDELKITRENTRKDKGYAELYANFIEGLSISQSLLEKIYTFQYAKHFFSEQELSELKEKWS